MQIRTGGEYFFLDKMDEKYSEETRKKINMDELIRKHLLLTPLDKVLKYKLFHKYAEKFHEELFFPAENVQKIDFFSQGVYKHYPELIVRKIEKFSPREYFINGIDDMYELDDILGKEHLDILKKKMSLLGFKKLF